MLEDDAGLNAKSIFRKGPGRPISFKRSITISRDDLGIDMCIIIHKSRRDAMSCLTSHESASFLGERLCQSISAQCRTAVSCSVIIDNADFQKYLVSKAFV